MTSTNSSPSHMSVSNLNFFPPLHYFFFSFISLLSNLMVNLTTILKPATTWEGFELVEIHDDNFRERGYMIYPPHSNQLNMMNFFFLKKKERGGDAIQMHKHRRWLSQFTSCKIKCLTTCEAIRQLSPQNTFATKHKRPRKRKTIYRAFEMESPFSVSIDLTSFKFHSS